MTVASRRIVFVVVAGVAVIAAFSIFADVRHLGEKMREFSWWPFFAALGLALTNYSLRFVRWSLYLRSRDIEVERPTSALVFVSGFALSITPGKFGELIKAYLLRETSDVPLGRSAPVVVAERVSDLIALIILGMIGVAVYGMARSMVFAGAAVLAVGLVALAWPRLGRGLIRAVSRPRPLRRFGGKLHTFYEGLAELARPRALAWSTPLAVVAWLCECIGFALIISGFAGTQVPLGLATLIYAATTIAGALSFLPGGLLVTEAGMTLMLVEASRGVDQTTAVAATILTRLATLWFAVLLGTIALAILRRRSSLSDIPLPDAGEDTAGG